jgi:processive 1,2-diacylglycerol beta-glucosyltransferase
LLSSAICEKIDRVKVSEAIELQPSAYAPPDPRRRVLILSAEEGEGHRAVARALQAELEDESAEVVVHDALQHVGRVIPFLSRDVYRVQLRCLTWTYGLECAFFARFPPGRAIARAGLAVFGSKPLLRLIRSVQPDVIVSTHPAATSIIGYLRRRGILKGPALATVSDFGVHPLWAHPGIDLHLVVHESCLRPVERVAGVGSARVVRPPVQAEFFERRRMRDARRGLGLPEEGPVILVSGGGWGVGKLARAVRAALRLEGATVICICGLNEHIRKRLEADFAAEPRAQILGFTHAMSDLIAASDAVVHSTAGVTCLEALVRGKPIIAFGSPAGHARWNAKTIAGLGMGEDTRTSRQLTAALTRAVSQRTVATRRLRAERPAGSLIVAARPRDGRPFFRRRRQALRIAFGLAVTTLVLAGWTFASAAPYPLVARMLHLRPVTTAPVGTKRVALVVAAPARFIPAIAADLHSQHARASFALARVPGRPLLDRIASFGDGALPALPAKALPHWISAGRGLGRGARDLGLGDSFYYLVPQKGFTLGEYVVARTVGGRPVSAAVHFEAGKPLPSKLPQAGDVVVLTLDDSSLSASLALVDRTIRVLSESSLRAVPFPGSSNTAPTAGEVARTDAPPTIRMMDAPSTTRSQGFPLQVSPARTGARATGTSVVRAKMIGAT